MAQTLDDILMALWVFLVILGFAIALFDLPGNHFVVTALGLTAVIIGLTRNDFSVRRAWLSDDRKAIPRWLGRLCFTCLGLLMMYWGLRRFL